jgi:mono/diheme cytochrome c family protein
MWSLCPALTRPVLISSALAAIIAGYIGPAAAEPGSPPDSRVERGRYLAEVADCAGCHTAKDGAPYAGGVELETPFGTLVAPNITQDPDSGIGNWTLQDFDAALRQGKDADGEPLYPAMPYVNFTKIRDDDLEALWAYVKTIEPVRNEVEVNQLPFPFNVRSGLLVWQALYFDEGRFEPDPSKSDEVNQGRYLATALAHCGACHTPRNLAGARIEGRKLGGGQIEEWYAPDIRTQRALDSWSVEELARFLGGERVDENITAFGRMYKVVHESLSKLPERDLVAIATYLKSTAVDEASGAKSAAAARGSRFDQGKLVYEGYCQNCHGRDGTGVRGVATSLAGNSAVTAQEPYNAISAILEGFAPRGVWASMPSFHAALDDQQIADVVNYVRQAWGNEGTPDATPRMVSKWRALADAPQPVVERATSCPTSPAAWRDKSTRERLAELGPDVLEPDNMRALVNDYRQRHPDLSRTDRIVALSGTYCRQMAEQLDSERAVIAQQLEFVSALASVDEDVGG